MYDQRLKGSLIVIYVLLIISFLVASCAPTTTPAPTLTLVPTKTPIYNPSGRYQNPGDYIHEMSVEGINRWFAVHIPAGYQPGAPIPLVINFHGRGSSALDQEDMSQMSAKADEGVFILVSPQALDSPSTWWGSVPRAIGNQDRIFVLEMVLTLRREISIDPARIYATGLSNGGAMANGMGCAFSNIFAAIAPVSGSHVLLDQCEPTRPLSVLAIHGTGDHILPYEGDYSYGDDRDIPSVHSWMEAWAERNGCDSDADVANPFPTITVETWDNCTEDVVVVLYTIEDGGHTWPTTRYGTDWGDIKLYIDATDLVWEFFAAHSRP